MSLHKLLLSFPGLFYVTVCWVVSNAILVLNSDISKVWKYSKRKTYDHCLRPSSENNIQFSYSEHKRSNGGYPKDLAGTMNYDTQIPCVISNRHTKWHVANRSPFPQHGGHGLMQKQRNKISQNSGNGILKYNVLSLSKKSLQPTYIWPNLINGPTFSIWDAERLHHHKII